MVFGSVPFANATNGSVDFDSELEYSASGGMGKIINNLSADAATNKSDDYYIVQTEINGNDATVTYSAIADCKVIVAVFDEDSGKMIGSGNAEVLSTETEATVTIDCSLPTEYVLKSYLVYFDANDGICTTASKAVRYDNSYEELPIATRIGYTFSGWYTEASGGQKVVAKDIVKKDLNHTIYAQWLLNCNA